MGDTQGLPAAGSGQTQNASPAPTGQGEQQQGATQQLTREEVLQMITDSIGKVTQSFADKTATRIQKIVQAAQAKGMQMSPQQAAALAEVMDAAEPKQPGDQPPTPQPPPAQAQVGKPGEQGAQLEQDDPVTAKARGILSTEFQLNPDEVNEADPEYKLLDLATEDPEKFITSVRAYGKAKQERQAAAASGATLPGLASRGGPSVESPYAGKRGTQILEEAYRNSQT